MNRGRKEKKSAEESYGCMCEAEANPSWPPPAAGVVVLASGISDDNDDDYGVGMR